MKKMFFYPLFSAIILTTVVSCSKCYDCSYVTEIENNGVVVKDTVTDEYCTASAEEIKEKEQQGQKCEAKQ